MKFRGTNAALAVLVSGALLLSGCTSGEDPEEDITGPGAAETVPGSGDPCIRDAGITETTDGKVVYSPGSGKWVGYNNLQVNTYSTYNSVVADQMFGNFWYYGTNGGICEDKEFGTSEVVSQDPLELKYTIADKATWSDGTPITTNDFLLSWAAQNPEFLVPGLANRQNKEAKAVFSHVSTTFAEQVPEGPQGEVGSKTFTIKFKGQYPDYKAILDPPLPAHVVAKQSGLEPDDLAKAILNRDAETVKKAADFWNNKWTFEPGQLPDASLIPSSSRYQLKQGGWKDSVVTLEANPNYWGTPAATKNLVFSPVKDDQMVQSLQNGDLDVIRPQATVDTIKQLEGNGSSVQSAVLPEMSWEHLDFNFRENNVFSDAKGGKKLREAFAYCVPRQTIVDQLIKPIKEDTQLLNSRNVLPFQSRYQEITSSSYDGRYDKVDIEKAKQLVAETGIQTPIDVRVGYLAGNQRRAETVAAIQSFCKDAGFNVIDSASQTFFDKEMTDGDYEVALFNWAGSELIGGGQNIQATGRGQNYGQYSNATVDQAWDKLTNTLDPKEQTEQFTIIEKELWDTLFSIPLYSNPGVVAWNRKIRNIRVAAGQSTVSWNAYQWKKK